jgi:hypothetical protein
MKCRGYPVDKNETEMLAYRIADDAAKIDLESFCYRPSGPESEWLNAKEVDGSEEKKCVRRAVRYLELRGKLKRHPDKPELVQVCA